MGKTPGRTYGKGLGAKLASLDELPVAVRAALEKKTPQIFVLPSWTPAREFGACMQERQPRGPFAGFHRARETCDLPWQKHVAMTGNGARDSGRLGGTTVNAGPQDLTAEGKGWGGYAEMKGEPDYLA